MAITTRGGKKIIEPPMPSNEEKMIKDNDKVVEVSGEVENNIGKDVEVPTMVIPCLDPPFLKDYCKRPRMVNIGILQLC